MTDIDQKSFNWGAISTGVVLAFMILISVGVLLWIILQPGQEVTNKQLAEFFCAKMGGNITTFLGSNQVDCKTTQVFDFYNITGTQTYTFDLNKTKEMYLANKTDGGK